MKAHMYGMTPDGRWLPLTTNDSGGGFAGGGLGASSASPLANGWSYAAASGGIENTSDVAIKTAAGAGRYNYLSSIQLMNSDTTVATEVVVKDGSTVLWRTYLPALAASTAPVPVSVAFSPPLVGSNNTALNVACITNSAKVYVNAQGFVSGPPNQVELQNNDIIEIVDRFANTVADRADNLIFLRSN